MFLCLQESSWWCAVRSLEEPETEEKFWWASRRSDETQYCLIRSFIVRPHRTVSCDGTVEFNMMMGPIRPTQDINFTWWLFYNFLPANHPAVNRVMLLLLIHQYDWVLAPLTLSVPRLSNTCFPTDYHQGSLDLSPANGDVCSWWRLEYSVSRPAPWSGQVRL